MHTQHSLRSLRVFRMLSIVFGVRVFLAVLTAGAVSDCLPPLPLTGASVSPAGAPHAAAAAPGAGGAPAAHLQGALAPRERVHRRAEGSLGVVF